MGYGPDLYKLLHDHEITDADDDQLYFTNLFLDEYQSQVDQVVCLFCGFTLTYKYRVSWFLCEYCFSRSLLECA